MSVRNGISVYHEGLTDEFAQIVWESGTSLYRVRPGRYGGWRGYRGEDRVLWDRFRYGKSSGGVDVETFLGLVCGLDMDVPGTYGQQTANWTRIDVCGLRLFSSLYARDKERDPSVAERLRNSFNYVVRYFEDTAQSGFVDAPVLGYVIPGSMYDDVDWRAAAAGSDLEFVEFVGSPASVEDYLNSRWVMETGRDEEQTSHMWSVSITNPRAWANAFCEANGAFDVYGTDWVDGADVVFSASQLVAPHEGDTGAIAGIRLIDGTRPVLRMLINTPIPMSLERLTDWMAGPISEAKPVVGDNEIHDFIDEVSGVSVSPVFSRGLARYSEWFYGRR